MGQQQTKAKAISALQLALEKTEPPLSVEQKEAIIKSFESILNA